MNNLPMPNMFRNRKSIAIAGITASGLALSGVLSLRAYAQTPLCDDLDLDLPAGMTFSVVQCDPNDGPVEIEYRDSAGNILNSGDTVTYTDPDNPSSPATLTVIDELPSLGTIPEPDYPWDDDPSVLPEYNTLIQSTVTDRLIVGYGALNYKPYEVAAVYLLPSQGTFVGQITFDQEVVLAQYDASNTDDMFIDLDIPGVEYGGLGDEYPDSDGTENTLLAYNPTTKKILWNSYDAQETQSGQFLWNFGNPDSVNLDATPYTDAVSGLTVDPVDNDVTLLGTGDFNGFQDFYRNQFVLLDPTTRSLLVADINDSAQFMKAQLPADVFTNVASGYTGFSDFSAYTAGGDFDNDFLSDDLVFLYEYDNNGTKTYVFRVVATDSTGKQGTDIIHEGTYTVEWAVPDANGTTVTGMSAAANGDIVISTTANANSRKQTYFVNLALDENDNLVVTDKSDPIGYPANPNSAPPATNTFATGPAIVLEAEDGALSTYRVENLNSASGGEVASFVGSPTDETGTSILTFNGTSSSGTYDLRLSTYDENDGIGTVSVSLNGNVLNSYVLNEDRGSPAANEATKVTYLVASDVQINNGDTLTITGDENGSEHIRVDYVSLTPKGEVPGGNPVQTTIEAENGVIGGDYFTDTFAGETVLTMSFNNPDEVGTVGVSATAAGSYDVYLVAHDESDGASTLIGTVDDVEFGRVKLNNSPGSNAPVLGNRITNYLGNVYLDPSDVLTVTAIENTGEHARLDKIILVPAGGIPPSDPGPSQFEVEAADSTLGGEYGYETINGNQVASLVGGPQGETGTMTSEFGGVAGDYRVKIQIHDENDGQSTGVIRQNGIQFGTFTLDQDLDSNLATAANLVTLDFGVRTLVPGDSFEIETTENAGEFGRLFKVIFEPVL